MGRRGKKQSGFGKFTRVLRKELTGIKGNMKSGLGARRRK